MVVVRFVWNRLGHRRKYQLNWSRLDLTSRLILSHHLHRLDVSHCIKRSLANLDSFQYVDYPPQVDEIQFQPEIEAPLGGSVVLKCAVRGNPSPSISWSKEGLLVSIAIITKEILFSQYLSVENCISNIIYLPTFRSTANKPDTEYN